MRKSKRIARGLIAGASIALGASVAVLISLWTSSGSIPIVVGLVVALIAWVGLEVWRAVREDDAAEGLTVVQRVRRVRGRLTGARGPVPQPTQVDMHIDTIEEGGQVIGYDSGGPRTSSNS
jgi:hypothetical protein